MEALRRQHVEEQTEFNAAVATALAAAAAASNVPSSSSSGSAVEPSHVETLPQLRPEQLELAERDSEDIKREITVLEAEKNK